jgi:hypothetical protein
MWRLLSARLDSWLNRKPGSGLLADPEYAGLHALEADMRRKHMNAAAVRKAKQDRLNVLLRNTAAEPVSRITLLNILGA